MRNIAQCDYRTVDCLDRQRIQCIEFLGAAIELYVIFERTDFLRPSRQDQILRHEGIGHFFWRQSFGAQQVRIKVDDNLSVLAAIG